MLFDEVLFEKLNSFAKVLCLNHNISEPKDYDTLAKFFETLSNGIEHKEVAAEFLGLTLYKFASSEEVRDRGTTGRVFEDLFGAITGAKVLDEKYRKDPICTKELIAYDKYCTTKDWLVSTSLSKNRREKGDHRIGDYVLSFKTLKGPLYNQFGRIVDKKFNNEVNVGSLSFRALFLNLIEERLGDRKEGLGSPRQTKPLLQKIIDDGNFDEFKRRVRLFMEYVYCDDIVVVFKSGYMMKVILIPAKSFREAVITTLDEKNPIDEFTSIWYRWENNNLRFVWSALYDRIKKLKLPMDEYDLKLYKVFEDKEFTETIHNIKSSLNGNLDKVLKEIDMSNSKGSTLILK